MRKSRFTEEQIIGISKEHEAGAKTEDLCRRHGISGATFYKWKANFGGLDVSDARKLKALEDENRRLKKLLAEQMLYRLYREEGLAVRRRRGRKRALGTRAPLQQASRPNEIWVLDFMSDVLQTGRRFRVF